MTDDLEGRIGPEDLVAKPPDAPTVYLGEEDGPTLRLDDVPAERAPVSVELRLTNDRVSHVIEGRLNAFSFGKGWLCAIEKVDEGKAIAAAALYASHKDHVEVVVEVDGARFKFEGDLDFAVGYSFEGCTFTVSADEGSYVDA